MFSGLLVSCRILSRLILLWYNPVTEEDVRLRHCLGVFFPMFAYASRYRVTDKILFDVRSCPPCTPEFYVCHLLLIYLFSVDEDKNVTYILYNQIFYLFPVLKYTLSSIGLFYAYFRIRLFSQIMFCQHTCK